MGDFDTEVYLIFCGTSFDFVNFSGQPQGGYVVISKVLVFAFPPGQGLKWKEEKTNRDKTGCEIWEFLLLQRSTSKADKNIWSLYIIVTYQCWEYWRCEVDWSKQRKWRWFNWTTSNVLSPSYSSMRMMSFCKVI